MRQHPPGSALVYFGCCLAKSLIAHNCRSWCHGLQGISRALCRCPIPLRQARLGHGAGHKLSFWLVARDQAQGRLAGCAQTQVRE